MQATHSITPTKASSTTPASGVVIYDPETGETIVAAAQTPTYFFCIFLYKKQYVGQLEALAALAAYTTAAAYRPGMFKDREGCSS